MSFQSSMNTMVGTMAAANKVKDIAPNGANAGTGKPMNFTEMNSAMAFQKSNQGLVEEYTKKQSNLQRSKNALTKMGRWGEKQDKQLKFYEDMIKRYQAVDMAVTGRINRKMDELAKEGERENGAKDKQ